MNRFSDDVIIDKVKMNIVTQTKIYRWDEIHTQFMSRKIHLKNKYPEVKLPQIWTHFNKFVSWYFFHNFPFIFDKKGKLFLPYRIDSPELMYPSSPDGIISNWQRRVMNLKPVIGGGEGRLYVMVEEYATGEMQKLRCEDWFNLEKFKHRLLTECFTYQKLVVHVLFPHEFV